MEIVLGPFLPHPPVTEWIIIIYHHHRQNLLSANNIVVYRPLPRIINFHGPSPPPFTFLSSKPENITLSRALDGCWRRVVVGRNLHIHQLHVIVAKQEHTFQFGRRTIAETTFQIKRRKRSAGSPPLLLLRFSSATASTTTIYSPLAFARPSLNSPSQRTSLHTFQFSPYIPCRPNINKMSQRRLRNGPAMSQTRNISLPSCIPIRSNWAHQSGATPHVHDFIPAWAHNRETMRLNADRNQLRSEYGRTTTRGNSHRSSRFLTLSIKRLLPHLHPSYPPERRRERHPIGWWWWKMTLYTTDGWVSFHSDPFCGIAVVVYPYVMPSCPCVYQSKSTMQFITEQSRISFA